LLKKVEKRIDGVKVKKRAGLFLLIDGLCQFMVGKVRDAQRYTDTGK
jgi:hypothetical protein